MNPQFPPARRRAAHARSAHALVGRAWTHLSARSRLARTGSTGSCSRWISSPEAVTRPHNGGRGALVLPLGRLLLALRGQKGRKAIGAGQPRQPILGGNQPNDRQVSSTHSICEQNVTSTFFAVGWTTLRSLLEYAMLPRERRFRSRQTSLSWAFNALRPRHTPYETLRTFVDSTRPLLLVYTVSISTVPFSHYLEIGRFIVDACELKLEAGSEDTETEHPLHKGAADV